MNSGVGGEQSKSSRRRTANEEASGIVGLAKWLSAFDVAKTIAKENKSASIAAVHDDLDFPSNLPVPTDDGGCAHLTELGLPPMELLAFDGNSVDLSSLPGRTGCLLLPENRQTGHASPKEWDDIPGARGCTPQACSFRDHHQELVRAGANRVFGLSDQDSAYQREAMERLHLPFALLSDASLAFASVLNLLTFEFEGETLIKRLTLVIDSGRISKVFYPVFSPDQERRGNTPVASGKSESLNQVVHNVQRRGISGLESGSSRTLALGSWSKSF